MRSAIIIGLVVLLGTSAPLAAESITVIPNNQGPPPALPAAAVQARPWQAAQVVLDAAKADVDAKGIKGIASHVNELELSLAGATGAIFATHPSSGPTYVLTDGEAKTPDPMTAGTGTSHVLAVVRVPNPYPMIALLLGSYYDEIGKPDEAVRVLDEGLSLYELAGYISPNGEHRSWLMLERSAAAMAQERFEDTLVIADSGLALSVSTDSIRAHFLRNKGFALTELNRLDDAEKAYEDSLKLDPSSDVARNELRYVTRLKAGSQKESGGLKPLPAPATGQ
jgi:hypothetical protein